MQDEVNERTVALSIKTAKLTGRVLVDTFSKCLAMWKKQRQAALAQHGSLWGMAAPPTVSR